MMFLFSMNSSHLRDVPPISTATFAILLTTFMEEPRRGMYHTNISRWLTESPFDIYVVDSSGLETLQISHPRLRFFSFSQAKGITSSSSVMEADSIVRALEHFALSEHHYDLIIKVTGKYFIPNFLDYTRNIRKDTDAVFQSLFNRSWQNSECFGMKPSLMKTTMSKIGASLMEAYLSELHAHNEWQVFRLEYLPLDRRTPRGDGTILKHL